MTSSCHRLAVPLWTALCVAPLAFPGVVHAPAEAPQPGAQKPKPAEVRFQPFVGTLDEARRSAAERNTPLLIHLILEGEPQNDEYRDQILPNAELQELCERAVVVVSNNGEHPPTTVKEVVDGHEIERPACSVYRFFESCNYHRETWDPLYFEYHEENGDLRCPQTVLLSPEGEIAWRCNTANPPAVSEVFGALKRAQREAGPGLTLEELARVKTHVARARKRALEGDHAGAWRSWQEVAELAPGGTYGEEAETGSAAAVSAWNAELEAARKLLVPGQAAKGYALLLELEAACVDTPFERQVKDALKQAERDKDIEDEIDAFKLEVEAQGLWDEALALVAEDDERKAERVLRRLLRKKYRPTKAAAAAREAYPELAAEVEASGK